MSIGLNKKDGSDGPVSVGGSSAVDSSAADASGAGSSAADSSAADSSSADSSSARSSKNMLLDVVDSPACVWSVFVNVSSVLRTFRLFFCSAGFLLVDLGGLYLNKGCCPVVMLFRASRIDARTGRCDLVSCATNCFHMSCMFEFAGKSVMAFIMSKPFNLPSCSAVLMVSRPFKSEIVSNKGPHSSSILFKESCAPEARGTFSGISFCMCVKACLLCPRAPPVS